MGPPVTVIRQHSQNREHQQGVIRRPHPTTAQATSNQRLPGHHQEASNPLIIVEEIIVTNPATGQHRRLILAPPVEHKVLT